MEDEDLKIFAVDLPMDKQQFTSLEDRIAFLKRVREQSKGVYKPNIFVEKPLTTDTIKRGYPPTEKELAIVKRINDYEQELINASSELKPNDSNRYDYYIVENGIVFKVEKNCVFFVLQPDTMKWVLYNDIVSYLHTNNLKYSKLKNFRDYYDMEIKNRKGVAL